MIYAILDQNGSILHIWKKYLPVKQANDWVNSGNSNYTIVAIEPRILAQRPLTRKGINQIKEFTLDKLLEKQGENVPDNILPSVI